ncbi:MAG: M23 family metallopeptidase [Bacteroidales bacterium]
MVKDKKRKYNVKYRLDITHEQTHENVHTLVTSKSKIILWISLSFIILLTLLLLLVFYTPLRLLIPGYPSSETRIEAVRNAVKVDSLQQEIDIISLQLTNIQKIVIGQEPIKIDSLIQLKSPIKVKKEITNAKRNKEDSLVRKEIMDYEKYHLRNTGNKKINQLENLLFFPPATGVITQEYDPIISHPFIDIAVPENTIVSATLDGTVIAAYWSDKTGYNIHIQHANNLISVYKHGIKLLVKTGDKVSAGTHIAIIGNTGELSTGSHLHFELWHNGEAIDPSLYIKF